MRKRILIAALLCALMAECTPAVTPTAPLPTQTIAPTAVPASAPWWTDSTFYEIFVRSFYDSNGDGIGDFNGIIQKLDYLNDGNPETTGDLGVTGIWLMPIFPSPSYHGYDVTDYYSVNPQYGTLDDFKNLVREAHRRGIHVIIDLVINHTSDQHPWFKSARRDRNSPYRNWYIWSDTNPGYKGPWNETVWHSSTTGFYYGIFEPFMPDLNYDNPAVTAEMTKVYSFWLKEVGVDGFRLDAAKHLIEEKAVQQNTPSTHQWYRQMYPVYKGMNPSAMTIGELFGDGMSVASGYVKNKEFDLVFNFQLAAAILTSVQSGRADNTAPVIETSNKFLSDFQYAPFLTNHDQNRVMSQLGNDVDKARVAASLLLTAPGTPFIYYGEEIGMTGMKPDENIRRPMQWSADPNAGFTTGKPWRQPDAGYPEFNVRTEAGDPNSLLAHYRGLVQLRNRHSALRSGKYDPVKSNNPDLYAALRLNADEILLVLVNLSDQQVSDYSLALEDADLRNQTYTAETLFGSGPAQSLKVTGGVFENYKPITSLPPYSTSIIKFQH